MTDSSEKRKLARQRLRRMRALVKQRKLEAKEKQAAKPTLVNEAPLKTGPVASAHKSESKERDRQRQVQIQALERDVAELSRLSDPTDATA
jgi:hypothetical protein